MNGYKSTLDKQQNSMWPSCPLRFVPTPQGRDSVNLEQLLLLIVVHFTLENIWNMP